MLNTKHPKEEIFMAASKRSVLFVCRGNTCRSPLAERLFSHMLEERGLLADWTVDSAAVSAYMVGYSTNPWTNYILEKNGIEGGNHIARQITTEDYEKFHYIFGFDEYILSILKKWKPADATCLVRLLGDLDPQDDRIIEDPIFDNDEAAFERVYSQCRRCLEAFLKEVLEECNGTI